jgi:hypothetical protein
LGKFSQLLLRARRGLSTFPRMPSPRNQIVMREMFMEQFQAAASVPVWVFELLTNL